MLNIILFDHSVKYSLRFFETIKPMPKRPSRWLPPLWIMINPRTDPSLFPPSRDNQPNICVIIIPTRIQPLLLFRHPRTTKLTRLWLLKKQLMWLRYTATGFYSEKKHLTRNPRPLSMMIHPSTTTNQTTPWRTYPTQLGMSINIRVYQPDHIS